MPNTSSITVPGSTDDSGFGPENVSVERSVVTGCAFIRAVNGDDRIGLHFEQKETDDLVAALSRFSTADEPTKPTTEELVDVVRVHALAAAAIIPGPWDADDVALFASFIIGDEELPELHKDEPFATDLPIIFVDNDDDAVTFTKHHDHEEGVVSVKIEDLLVYLDRDDLDDLIDYLTDVRASL